MGGGGLRILPHKSWNVYNQKNRDRVARDEEQARKEAEEKDGRARAAAQERRLESLRVKASGRRDDRLKVEPSSTESLLHDGVHVHLFPQQGKPTSTTNDEYEAEKAAEKAKFEKQITMYLGGERGEKTGVVPWYATDKAVNDLPPVGERPFFKSEGSQGDKKPKRKRTVDDFEDPMAKLLQKTPSADPRSDSTSKKPKSTKPKTIEELRQERLARELKERQRAEELLNPKPVLSLSESLKAEREMGYNSGFNRDLSRQGRRGDASAARKDVRKEEDWYRR
ncbi:hypothetical protein DFJ73DRAFT_810590 [Zopfochytrium polystomum]|nr:hypothetical protein DFJ73DRAFT_810590 [Zopfochytrium polystomum]